MAELEATRDYRRIEAAIALLAANFQSQPGLDDMAQAAGLSPQHFQRLFARWAGISPTRFMQYLTLERAKSLLAQSRPVLDAALEAGLSGPGRLHDLFVTFEALSPGEYKRQGAGVELVYGVHQGPFGPFLLIASPRGVCGLAFVTGSVDEALADFRARWPLAEFSEDAPGTAAYAERVFPDRNGRRQGPLSLIASGTNFQVKVWEALLSVPPGAVVSYNDLARAIGRERCPRAIGNAMGANPLAYVIPCHRVIRASGVFNGYRWGLPKRLAMLGWEQARRETEGREGESQSPSTSFME
jgi:AraC family transcriptional regulator of adaptative response/methylated-DNA-[protein]-cysteine methyltransferase